MSPFSFDSQNEQKKNIMDFIDYIEGIDTKFGAIIRKHLDLLVGFPDMQAAEKSRLRQIITRDVLQVIENDKEEER